MTTARVRTDESSDDLLVVRLGGDGDGRLTGSDLKALTEVVSTAGERHILLLPGGADFCLGRREDPAEGVGLTTRQRVLDPIAGVYEAIRDHPGAVVAAVRGRCYGLGFALACAVDLLVAAHDAEFALPEARAGFAPLLALSQVGDRLPAPVARRLALTCAPVGVADLAATGLFSAVVSPAGLETAAHELAADLAGVGIVRDVKTWFAEAAPRPARDRVAYAVDGLERAFADR